MESARRPRRLHARLCAPRRTAELRRPSSSSGSGVSRARACSRKGRTTLPGPCRANRTTLVSLLDELKRRRGAARRLRRLCAREHAPQLLRDRHELSRLHRRPKRAEARPLLAGNAHPVVDPERIAGDAAGLRARDRVELRRRDHPAAGGLPRRGASFILPLPEPRSIVAEGLGVLLRSPTTRSDASCALAFDPSALRAASRCMVDAGARGDRSRAGVAGGLAGDVTEPTGRDHLRRRFRERRRARCAAA